MKNHKDKTEKIGKNINRSISNTYEQIQETEIGDATKNDHDTQDLQMQEIVFDGGTDDKVTIIGENPNELPQEKGEIE